MVVGLPIQTIRIEVQQNRCFWLIKPILVDYKFTARVEEYLYAF
jgi:hypothetical protein